MSGQMTKYEQYLKSLESMKEPTPANLVFNMRGAVEYAESKGVKISELSEEEKKQFIKEKTEAMLA